jgi:Lysozyme like domain
MRERFQRRWPALLLAAVGSVFVLVVVLESLEGEKASGAAVAQAGVTGTALPVQREPVRPRARIKAIVCRVFGPRCGAALRVASCETGGTFYPRARGSAGERGLFQIHPVHFGWLNERRLYEPRYNARAAFRLSRGGRDWSHWTCRP